MSCFLLRIMVPTRPVRRMSTGQVLQSGNSGVVLDVTSEKVIVIVLAPVRKVTEEG